MGICDLPRISTFAADAVPARGDQALYASSATTTSRSTTLMPWSLPRGGPSRNLAYAIGRQSDATMAPVFEAATK